MVLRCMYVFSFYLCIPVLPFGVIIIIIIIRRPRRRRFRINTMSVELIPFSLLSRCHGLRLPAG